MAKEKVLPHNTEAEKAVLGAMLLNKKYVADACARLDVEDFFEKNENHRAIFSAILRLYTRGVPVDTQTVTDELINSKELEIAGAPEYLIELTDAVITFENFDNYLKIVRDQSILRNFLVTLDSISKKYYSEEIESINDFLKESEKKINDACDKGTVGEFKNANQISKEISKEFENLKTTTSDDLTTGTPTGFPKLNTLTHGFHEGELIILAARPGVGKTALSLNLAYNAATRGNVPVAYFSLEMPASMLFKRLVSADANVKFDSLMTGYNVDKKVRLNLAESCKRLASTKIYVDDTAGIKLLDLVARCRKLKEQEPALGLIVVDYIGLVTTSAKTKSESRQLEVQMISQTLKKMALDLRVPVLGVAQLNRNVEMRQGGEPQLSDLRESGSIEQDADIVLMLHESKLEDKSNSKNVIEKQNAAVERAKAEAAGIKDNDTRLVTILIRKNRSGKTGRVPLLFRRDYCKFDAPTEECEAQLNAIEAEKINYIDRGEN